MSKTVKIKSRNIYIYIYIYIRDSKIFEIFVCLFYFLMFCTLIYCQTVTYLPVKSLTSLITCSPPYAFQREKTHGQQQTHCQKIMEYYNSVYCCTSRCLVKAVFRNLRPGVLSYTVQNTGSPDRLDAGNI